MFFIESLTHPFWNHIVKFPSSFFHFYLFIFFFFKDEDGKRQAIYIEGTYFCASELHARHSCFSFLGHRGGNKPATRGYPTRPAPSRLCNRVSGRVFKTETGFKRVGFYWKTRIWPELFKKKKTLKILKPETRASPQSRLHRSRSRVVSLIGLFSDYFSVSSWSRSPGFASRRRRRRAKTFTVNFASPGFFFRFFGWVLFDAMDFLCFFYLGFV